MNAVSPDADPSTMLFNVAIIPPTDIAAEAIALSREARSLGGRFELDTQFRHAHVTVYMARFPSFNMDSTRIMLTEILSPLEKQTLVHSGYYLTPQSYYEISYARTPELMKVHHRITAQLHELRYSPGNPVVEDYFGPYRDEIKANVERWGYDLAEELYRPHLTLTRFPTEPEVATPQELLPTSERDLSFEMDKIGLFQADNMGSAREPISIIEI